MVALVAARVEWLRQIRRELAIPHQPHQVREVMVELARRELVIVAAAAAVERLLSEWLALLQMVEMVVLVQHLLSLAHL